MILWTIQPMEVYELISSHYLTVADYTAIAHKILGKPTVNFNEQAADVNNDGNINMADYTGVVHLLLYGTIEKPSDK